jgi:tetratricopeptide (TPR) repeat protein
VPDQPYFLNNRGYIFLSRNEFDLALADIDRSMTIDPYNGWAFRNKGILYFRKGDMARSERLLEQALLINENIDHVHYYLGMTYINQGKAKEGCGHVRLSEARDEGMVTAEDLRKCPLE